MRHFRRHVSRVIAALAAAMLVAVPPPIAHADHDGETHAEGPGLNALIADVAEANQRLADIGAEIQGKQEGVNKALVDVSSARESTQAARREVATSQQRLAESNIAIGAAQQRFDDFAAATYVNGPSGSYLAATNPAEMIATASAGQTVAHSFDQTLTDLRRARTEQANQAAAARAAEVRADAAAADAQRAQIAAVAALTDARRQFGAQQAEVDRLGAERAAAQARLDAVRPPAPPVAGSTADPAARPMGADRWDPQAPPGTPAEADTSQWDITLPMVPSANVPGDPIAVVNSVLQISATSAQLTADMGRKFLTRLGILPQPASVVADPGFTNGQIPRVYGQQASELVIRRAMSQLGVPYSWGGGNANGPSRGIDRGANTVGFDCSGLMLYAFAGVGIKLDHYSGSQYNAGRKIPSAQMRRGDLIFYGPNASQHEAMYLGNGQMLEAPYTGSQVRIAPVRTSGMTPYVTRLIEY